ncbi:MAG: hypothetical protein Unbinned1966contig1000_41 [Prokaryotic dsDNA virus sp.]|nr:MAG: hypothetical protein Unbinned1966contig1000_41 [Prokaryotic dsDNA virus sp.]|tara:strand:+ start:9439 stop:9999 length:561 start_codon:yes stop_codon:yes gene_type:complete
MAFNRRGRRPMPAGGNSGMNNNMGRRRAGNSRFAPRGPQRFGVNPGPMPAGQTSDNTGNFGAGRRQDPRYVQPQNNNTTFGGQGGMQDNVGGGRRQDPRYVQPQNTPRIGNQGQGQRFSPTGVGQGRRPAGLPNIEMRKPGSGGSRVMNTPSMGRRNFMRPNQRNQQNNLLGRRRNNKLNNNNSGY